MMTSLARRMATSTLCGASQTQHSPNTSLPYPTRMEKVKFGIPLENVCGAHNDIPGPLLVMILKLNKEAPFKKDVFRAPGHQANMKKLIHFLQNGRLVNIDNYSVYTIASVLKKFLRKLPSGLFGPEREQRLFQIIEWQNVEEKREEIHRILTSLPVVTQHLLVLLFGTFRAMATSSDRANTGMTSEAIGVSVAPSFFQSCVQDGSKFAKMEDVQRFKVATTIMKFLIDNFGVSNLFGRDNYEYYARISGRVLKVEENWIFAFKYPPDTHPTHTPISSSEECQSTPTLCTTSGSTVAAPHLSAVQMMHQNIDDSYARLSMSLEENVFKSTHSSPNSPQTIVSVMMHQNQHNQQSPQTQQTQAMVTEEALNLDDLKTVNRYAESTKSLTFLPIVHERQTQRMKTRSEWFLNPSNEGVSSSHSFTSTSTTTANQRRAAEQSMPPSMAGSSVKQLVRRTSSKEKRLVRRSSSKKDKENGTELKAQHSSGGVQSPTSAPITDANQLAATQTGMCSESDTTDCDVQQMNTTLTYKPRI